MRSITRVMHFRIASPVLSGLIWSVIWLGIGTLALSFLVAGNSVREDELLPWAFGVHGAAALAGGFAAARRSGRKGWYYGALNGVLYTLAILLTSFLAADLAWSLRIPAMLGLTCLAGIMGGIFGVNTGAAAAGRK